MIIAGQCTRSGKALLLAASCQPTVHIAHCRLVSAKWLPTGPPAPSLPAPADLALHHIGFERCVALLLQLLLPMPLHSRSGALSQLQAKLSGTLLTYLGNSLERVLESDRACQVGGGGGSCSVHCLLGTSQEQQASKTGVADVICEAGWLAGWHASP